jgi:hypothetical protein
VNYVTLSISGVSYGCSRFEILDWPCPDQAPRPSDDGGVPSVSSPSLEEREIFETLGGQMMVMSADSESSHPSGALPPAGFPATDGRVVWPTLLVATGLLVSVVWTGLLAWVAGRLMAVVW